MTKSPRRFAARRLHALVAGTTLVLASTLLPSGTAAADPSPSAPGQTVAESKRETRALRTYERALRVLDPAASAPNRDATVILRDLRFRLEALPPTQRAAAREIVARPDDGVAARLGCGATNQFVVVHCRAAPIGYTAQDVVDAFEAARAQYAAMGYRAVPSDGSKYDVYIEDLDPGLFGYTQALRQRRVTPSFIGINRDFSWWTRQEPVKTMQVTMAHEFFHAIQFGYDAAEDSWLMEATATWAEEQVPLTEPVNDNRTYLRWSPLSRPARPMTRFDGQFPYGSWIFFQYLTERFRDPGIVRAIWNRAVGDQYSLPAIDGALHARNTDLARVFTQFSDANRRPAQTYAEGTAYRAKPLTGQRTFQQIGAAQVFTTPALNQLSSATYRFVSRGLPVAARLRLAIDMPAMITGSRAVVTTYRTSGAVRSRIVRLGLAGNRTLSVPFGSGDVQAVEVTLANASRRMTACGMDVFSPWPCGGHPRDSASVGTVRGLVARR